MVLKYYIFFLYSLFTFLSCYKQLNNDKTTNHLVKAAKNKEKPSINQNTKIIAIENDFEIIISFKNHQINKECTLRNKITNEIFDRIPINYENNDDTKLITKYDEKTLQHKFKLFKNPKKDVYNVYLHKLCIENETNVDKSYKSKICQNSDLNDYYQKETENDVSTGLQNNEKKYECYNSDHYNSIIKEEIKDSNENDIPFPSTKGNFVESINKENEIKDYIKIELEDDLYDGYFPSEDDDEFENDQSFFQNIHHEKQSINKKFNTEKSKNNHLTENITKNNNLSIIKNESKINTEVELIKIEKNDENINKSTVKNLNEESYNFSKTMQNEVMNQEEYDEKSLSMEIDEEFLIDYSVNNNSVLKFKPEEIENEKQIELRKDIEIFKHALNMLNNSDQKEDDIITKEILENKILNLIKEYKKSNQGQINKENKTSSIYWPD